MELTADLFEVRPRHLISTNKQKNTHNQTNPPSHKEPLSKLTHTHTVVTPLTCPCDAAEDSSNASTCTASWRSFFFCVSPAMGLCEGFRDLTAPQQFAGTPPLHNIVGVHMPFLAEATNNVSYTSQHTNWPTELRRCGQIVELSTVVQYINCSTSP